MDANEMRNLGTLPIMFYGNYHVEQLPCGFHNERRDVCGKKGYSSIYLKEGYSIIACQTHWDNYHRKLSEVESKFTKGADEQLKHENKRLKELLAKLSKDIITQRTYQKMGMNDSRNDIAFHAKGGYDLCEYIIKENPIINELLATEGADEQ